MLDAFLLTHCFVKRFDSSLYRLLKRRKIVAITSRMMDFGKQTRVLKTGNTIRIGLGSMKLSE